MSDASAADLRYNIRGGYVQYGQFSGLNDKAIFITATIALRSGLKFRLNSMSFPFSKAETMSNCYPPFDAHELEVLAFMRHCD
jgi:hypothetical protein